MQADIVSARKLANQLQTNKDFYREVVKIGKFNYNQWYKEEVFIKNFKI